MARPERAVQDDAEFLAPGLRRAMLLAVQKRSGVKRVRVNIPYSKTLGGRDWSAYDDAFKAIRAAHMKPQVTLMADPQYDARSPRSRLSAANSDPMEMARFASSFARHFRGKVDRVSIGNEPNHPAFLQSKTPAKDYRRLLDAGTMGIRSQDPRMKVLMGELQPWGGLKFLRRVVKAGGPLKTDGVALHPYGDPFARSHRGDARIADLPHVARVLRKWARQGRLQSTKGGRADLYVTEMGFQHSAGSQRKRLRQSRKAYSLAERAGARQYLQYQATPKMSGWDTSLPADSLAARLSATKRRR